MDDLARLLVAARDGDRTALVAAVRRAQPEVWRFLAHLDGSGEADDLTQETFVRAFRSLPGYRGEAGGRTWLLGIAHRTWVDAIRRRTRQRRLRDRLGSRADTHAPDLTGAVEVGDLLGRLDPDRRAAFVLTQVVGMSYEEAAVALGVPIGTIRSRVARARRDLVEGLADEQTG